MRRKAAAKASQGGAKGNFNTHLKSIKQTGRPSKSPTGKGLGKAGAKRLGRLLKRAIVQGQEEPTGEAKASLPKTPVRLFKHQIQKEADNAPKTNTEKTVSSQVSQLILSVVSQCKHKGGISMAELKQTMAAGGYDVTKNNRRVNMVTKRLVNSETLVCTTRLRLNNKKLTETTRQDRRTISVKAKAELKQSTAAIKSPRRPKKSQRRVIKTPKPRSRTYKATAKSRKQTDKTRKPAVKSHQQRRKAPKERRKSSQPAVKKRRSVANRGARVRKAPRKAQRTRTRRPKQIRQLNKSSRKRQPARRRLPKTRPRLKAQQRRDARRRTYYYY